jgi:ABC-2 type transport system permease protein
MPLEFFPDGMRAVARLTPHAWANEAMAEIVRRDGGIGDVLPELGVLAVYAVVVLSLSVVLLRRALTR